MLLWHSNTIHKFLFSLLSVKKQPFRAAFFLVDFFNTFKAVFTETTLKILKQNNKPQIIKGSLADVLTLLTVALLTLLIKSKGGKGVTK